MFILQWKGCGRPPSGGAAGGWLAGVCNPIRLRFSLKKSLYNMAKSRRTCREGDGWRWDTARDVGFVLAQRKPERERGWRVRVGEEEEERPRRKAGRAAGMDGDRTGDLKGKATPRSAPGHPWGCWGGTG